MNLNIELAQKQILSQYMIQSMEILQMSTQELEDFIGNLALENPVVDLTAPPSLPVDSNQEDLQRKLDWLESTDLQNKVYYQHERSAENMEQNWHDKRDMEEGLCDYLLSQILYENYTELEHDIVEFIILSLDSRGYLTDDISFIASYFSVSEDMVQKLLQQVQALVPAGIAARNLKECLLLQLYRKNNFSPITEAVITEYLQDVAKNHLPNIAKKLHVSLNDILDACAEIRELNPKPGNAFSNREQLHYISPDAVVIKMKNQFEILINEYQYPHFSINSYYMELLKSTNDTEVKNYLQDKVSQAKCVQEFISQRTITLSRVMHVLVEKQIDFFLCGPGHKRPMKLSDIANELDVHESTISRTLRGKYLQCSFGVFPLNYFLTSVVTKSFNREEEKTPEQIKEHIQEIINAEDKKKPLSDQKISERLMEFNIKISRRTVTKYRLDMNLPDKGGRKEW